MKHYYRPQASFAKVMFLQVSVCPQGRGRAWQWGMRGRGGGNAWWVNELAVRILLEYILVLYGSRQILLSLTRMHCSRMRTARSSSCPGGRSPPGTPPPPGTRHPSPPVDRILDTRFSKYYLAPNFVSGGKNTNLFHKS